MSRRGERASRYLKDQAVLSSERRVVAFDEDWEKFAAIDTALSYALSLVRVRQEEIRAQVSRHRSIDSKGPEDISALFEAVLEQQGYMVVAVDSEDES